MAVIPFIIALLALFLVKFLWEDWRMLRGDSIAIEATVIEHAHRLTQVGSGTHSRGTGSGGIITDSWTAVYRFTASDGRVHDVPDAVWSTNQGSVPAIGSKVTLRYFPEAPEQAAPYTLIRRAIAYAAVLGMMGAMAYVWLHPGQNF